MVLEICSFQISLLALAETISGQDLRYDDGYVKYQVRLECFGARIAIIYSTPPGIKCSFS